MAHGETRTIIDLDTDLIIDGWQEYLTRAQMAKQEFSYSIQKMLDEYGVETEAQLVSGRMVSIRSRISEREREDFSVKYPF